MMVKYYFSIFLSLFMHLIYASRKIKLPDVSSLTVHSDDSISHFNAKVNGTNILVMMARDTEDIELITMLTILRKAKINTQFSGLKNVMKTVILQYKLSIVPDADMEIVWGDKPYDMIILPGGNGYVNYYRAKKLERMVREQDGEKRYLALMSTAPLYLQHLNIAVGKHITLRPTWSALLGDQNPYHNYGVVQDGHILTCQGPASAMEFAFHIVEIFRGKEHASRVAEMISYKRNLSDILVVNGHHQEPMYLKPKY